MIPNLTVSPTWQTPIAPLPAQEAAFIHFYLVFVPLSQFTIDIFNRERPAACSKHGLYSSTFFSPPNGRTAASAREAQARALDLGWHGPRGHFPAGRSTVYGGSRMGEGSLQGEWPRSPSAHAPHLEDEAVHACARAPPRMLTGAQETLRIDIVNSRYYEFAIHNV